MYHVPSLLAPAPAPAPVPLGTRRISSSNAKEQVQQEGYKSLTTQIFDQECKYLDKDSVFAVKDELKVEFVPRKGDPQAPLELEYNITLAKTS